MKTRCLAPRNNAHAHRTALFISSEYSSLCKHKDIKIEPSTTRETREKLIVTMRHDLVEGSSKGSIFVQSVQVTQATQTVFIHSRCSSTRTEPEGQSLGSRFNSRSHFAFLSANFLFFDWSTPNGNDRDRRDWPLLPPLG